MIEVVSAAGERVKSRAASLSYLLLAAALLGSCGSPGLGTRKADTGAPTITVAGASEDPSEAGAGYGPGSATDSAGNAIRPNADEEKPEAKRYTGTGVFIRRTAPVHQAFATDTGKITLNFVDAEVRDVVRTVLGGTLGLNYAIDPSIKGAITLQTSKPLRREDVLPTLENVLRLNGVALVRAGEVYNVVPSDSAPRGTVAPRLRGMPIPAGEAFGIQIVPLEYAGAAEMAQIIEPLAAPGSLLRTDVQRNLLIIAGTRRERETLLEMIDLFDVDWLAGMSFAMIPLEYAKPEEMIEDLDKVFGGTEEGPLAGVVRFYPVERRNAILAISSRPDYVQTAQDWIDRLDVGDTEDEQLFVYRVQNARATDVAAILSQVFSAEGTAVTSQQRDLAPGITGAQLTSRPSSRDSGSPLRSTPTLSAQTVGPALGAAQAVRQPDTPSGSSGTTGAPSGQRPSAASRPSPVRGTAVPRPSGGGSEADKEPPVRIIADDVNNSLVIMARPRVYRMIEAALRKLDVIPLLVLIEASIAEVRLDNDLQYGVQWFFRKGNNSFTFGDPSGTLASAFAGFTYAFTTSSIQAVLQALETVTKVKVISAPQLMVLDNRTAELLVGDQVPVATQSSVSVTDPAAPVVNSIQYLDTGVVLRVTPRVNASGLVTLEIEQEQSDANRTVTSNIDSPTISQRRITSSVVVRSGETVALGGLITGRDEESETGIPLLSRIPILGNLFKTTDQSGRRAELIVLITPRVVRNQEEARSVTEELRKRLKDASTVVEKHRRKGE